MAGGEAEQQCVLPPSGPALSPEDTIAIVKLDNFNCSTLRDQVHPGLNRPAADNDLKYPRRAGQTEAAPPLPAATYPPN